MTQKITPFLWFDNNAEEAVEFYATVFKDAKTLAVARYPEGAPGPAGSVMIVDFELFGQRITALNGGPHFKLNEAFSLVVHCKDQQEIDHYWSALTADGGQESMCGWLKDKFGLSWQIVSDEVIDMIKNGDEASQRAFKAIMPMKKIDIQTVRDAYEGK